MGSNDGDLKLIVGIDYGTTYSGLSFALSNATGFQDIVKWTKYPEAPTHAAEHNEKAPTRIAFADENVELYEDVWGYQVESRMKSCALTKLLLDKSTQSSEYDDPSLYDAPGCDLMRLPPGKKAEDVVTAYLTNLFKVFEEARDRHFGCMSPEELPVEFWFTVPASWSEKAKLLTKKAAHSAGFGARGVDSVMLISEPEAAAHYALKSGIHRLKSFVQPNTGVMVCDCGGGTVDITTYAVEQTEPTVKLREIAVGIAGKCGATYVDRNFHRLLAQRFGHAFTSLDTEQIGFGSAFMDRFEDIKKDFRGTAQTSKRTHRLPLYMPLLRHTPELEEFYEMRTSSVLLNQNDFKLLFDPVIDKILELIHDQVSQVEQSREPSIDTIVLVGGFASSPYLVKLVQDWCRPRGLKLVIPMLGAWSAIVCGAVLRGLEGCIVRKRKCRRHYGCSVSKPYLPTLHEKYDRATRNVWRDPFADAEYLDGFLDWQISKGEEIDQTSEINLTLAYIFKTPDTAHTWELYSCNLDEAPQTVESARVESVGDVHFVLNATDFENFETIVDKGRTYYKGELTLNVRLDDQKGHLVFRVMYEGREFGKAEIDLDD